MNDRFTRGTVRQAFLDILEERGRDHVYEGRDAEGNCRYFKDGEPSCIVGHIVHRIDPELGRSIAALEDEWGHSEEFVRLNQGDLIFNTDDDRLAGYRCITQDLGLAEALEKAQGVQDRGGEWGEAYWEFDAVLQTLPQDGFEGPEHFDGYRGHLADA